MSSLKIIQSMNFIHILLISTANLAQFIRLEQFKKFKKNKNTENILTFLKKVFIIKKKKVLVITNL